ncbi:MAG: MarR family transcriptional regulator [Roseinatronobacter sp.]|jgi:DNA-binding MarR family transcriptional regulator|nr:MarR family transcriptional regulator [Roseinatronobacter sp.]
MPKMKLAALDEESDIEGLLGYNLKRAYMIVRDDFRRQVEQSDLSPRAFSVLTLIVETPGLTQSEVARHLGIERSGLVAIIDDLEAHGLAERTAVPGDRRSQALIATPKGRAFHAETMARVHAHEHALLAPLSPGERTQLLILLRKFRAAHEEVEL